MKELKDYIHLYIGSKVSTIHPALFNGKAHELTISINNLYEIIYKYQDSKLILRRLSDMTDEEATEYFSVCSLGPGDYIGGGPQWIPISARSTHWLLSKSFDLFGLIDAGLAIDRKLTTV